MERSGQQHNRRIFGWIAIIAVAYHALAMVLLHLLAPDVNPVTDMVGAYLAGPYQLLARSTFLALACALACLGLALAGRLAAGAVARLAMGLLVVASAGFLGVAAAPEAAGVFAAPTRLSTVVSILLLSVVLPQHPQWRRVGKVLLLIGAALVTIFVLTVVLGTFASMGYGGLANRAVLVLIYSWLILVAAGTLKKRSGARLSEE